MMLMRYVHLTSSHPITIDATHVYGKIFHHLPPISSTSEQEKRTRIIVQTCQ